MLERVASRIPLRRDNRLQGAATNS
jgi:hypothetical protein